MVDRGIYQQLAEQNAAAIQGLNPKISIWTTGQGGSDGDAASSLQNIMKMVPPLVETIETQTGLTPKDWLLKSSKDSKEQSQGPE